MELRESIARATATSGGAVGFAGRHCDDRALRAVVALLAAPLGSLDLGQSDSGQLPVDTTARQAYDLLSDGFGPWFNGPLVVAVSPPRHSRDA